MKHVSPKFILLASVLSGALALCIVGSIKASAANTSAPSPTKSTVTVHISLSPTGVPVSGRPTTLTFMVNDKDGHFSNQNCHCRLTIQQHGKTLLDKVLSQKTDRPTTSFIFPRGGTYTINLSGVPSSGNAFHPFASTYNQVVHQNRNWWQIILGVAALVLGALLLAVVLGANRIHDGLQSR